MGSNTIAFVRACPRLQENSPLDGQFTSQNAAVQRWTCCSSFANMGLAKLSGIMSLIDATALRFAGTSVY